MWCRVRIRTDDCGTTRHCCSPSRPPNERTSDEVHFNEHEMKY
ncbi:hypothetical protein F6X37_28190 [Paraburkholderia sp. 31.1]|nr:hypothetical protein [Paraburkholderia sp. 31.1]